MTRCKLCNYPEKASIEERIAARELSQAQAAVIVDCNPSAISRHFRLHVVARIKEAIKPELTQVDGLNVVNALISLHETTLDILQDSLAEGDRRTALMALQTEIKQLELNAKLTGQLNDAPQVNFLLNPEFVRLKQILIKTLEPYPEARVRLSEALTEIADDGENYGKNGKGN